MKRTVVIGGGTFSHLRNHLSLSAIAFGTTAKRLHELLPGSDLQLTKMADSSSSIVTNENVSRYIDSLLADKMVGTIVFNVAMCDFDGHIGAIESGKYAERLKTSGGVAEITITPAEKVISKIRRKRPDIFLVGFKTTCNLEPREQFARGLKLMKQSKCNLVLANDTGTRCNLIIVPEEAVYDVTCDRGKALEKLARFIIDRRDLTYNRTYHAVAENVPIENCSDTFKDVMTFLINVGAFTSINGNGFTPGHFCQKISNSVYLSSQRKVNHGAVLTDGLTKVTVVNGKILSEGANKPSVGFTSQKLLLDAFPQFDCVMHTHNPIRHNSDLAVVSQRPYQCGSNECSINTLERMELYDDGHFAAIYLENHGINLLFSSDTMASRVISFLRDNVHVNKTLVDSL